MPKGAVCSPYFPKQRYCGKARNALKRKVFQAFGEWRSLVAHLLWEQRVAGSNPVSPTIVFKFLLVKTAVPGGGFATQFVT